MYGDNKANQKRVSLQSIKIDASNLDMNIYTVSCRVYTAEEILILAEKSQEITDKLNHLYEQMKGE